jgi:CHAT domain-containing protein
VLLHFERMARAEQAEPGVYAGTLLRYWQTLDHHGHHAQARALEDAQLEMWFAGLRDETRRSTARTDLMSWARGYYGARAHGARMEALHQRLAAALGQGDLVTLAMLRARIFNHRQLSRPAQALALTEAFAALAARHHPADERLRMGNVSERVGALAGVGRLADAFADGQELLAWQQAHTPTAHANLMRSAMNLASLCIQLADYDAAERYAQLSITAGSQAAAFNERHEALVAATSLAQARLLRGDAQGAEGVRQALQAWPAFDLGISSALFTLSRHTQRSGPAELQQWAQDTFQRLIATNTSALQPERAWPLYLQAVAHPPGAELALQPASEVLAYGLIGRDPSLAVLSHFALARHLAASQPEAAVWLYKRGARALQALREALPQGTASVQQAWLAEYEEDLRQFIGLLIDQGRLAEAEQAIEVLREEELQEFRRRSRGARLARSEAGAAVSFTLAEAQRNAALQPTEAAIQAASAQADRRADERLKWVERVQQPDTEADAALAQAAQAVRSLAQAATPAGRRAAEPPAVRLAPGLARLSFFVRPQAVEAVLQIGRRRYRLTLPHTERDINRTVQALRAELAKPNLQVPAAAQQLHRWLIQPLQHRLAGVQHLHVVPDAALRYVPFAALHDGQGYLALRHSVSLELSRAPGRAAGADRQPIRLRPTRPRMAAFGRTQPDAQHSALPGVQDELAVLGALRGAQVSQAVDAQFTAMALTQALEQMPQLVHLASHFVLDAAGEEASYLLLGDGSRMPLRELRTLPWAGVDLALLSACDSGLALDAPGSTAQGRELAGFAATLQAAGVRNVMATLWRIDDASTAQWMQAFYAPWQRAGAKAPLDARHLAQVQRDWLRRHAGTVLAHPHHWAAFSWMGPP